MPRPILHPYLELWTTLKGYIPWSQWLVNDQRFVDDRPDVLVYETPVLTSPIRVRFPLQIFTRQPPVAMVIL
jgi:hypothetical protein